MSTVYVDLALKTFETGEGVAGAVLKHRTTAGEKDTFYNYETFKIASLYSENEESKFYYLVKVIRQIVDELPEGTDTVVIRSSLKHFLQHRRLNRKVGLMPVKVIPMYYERLKAIEEDAYTLCEDAADRKSNVIVEI